MKAVDFYDLGFMNYHEAWNLQKSIQSLLISEKRNEASQTTGQTSSDVLLFVEHPHVYTLGKSGKQDHLLVNEEMLKLLDAEFVKIDRGGDITYHGPGQIVGYPILDLSRHFTDIHRYLRTLEEIAIRTCNDYGIKARRIEGLTGVWVNKQKICAFGVKCSRWVTTHGFAFNVHPDLSYFNAIVPCGIADHGVTSLKKLLGNAPDMDEVKQCLTAHFAALFEVQIVEKTLDLNRFSMSDTLFKGYTTS